MFPYGAAHIQNEEQKMRKTHLSEILIVDDDKDMCESLADVISLDSDYRVKYTTSPLKALKMIKSSSFSLAIIDYKMPEMDGVELLKKIKETSSNLPTFILTAFISTELIREATKEGAEKVLSKFIWPDELLKHIKNALK